MTHSDTPAHRYRDPATDQKAALVASRTRRMAELRDRFQRNNDEIQNLLRMLDSLVMARLEQTASHDDLGHEEQRRVA